MEQIEHEERNNWVASTAAEDARPYRNRPATAAGRKGIEGEREVRLRATERTGSQADWDVSRSGWASTLSARVLRAKYFPNVSLLDAELGQNPSQIWRAILDGRDALSGGLIRRIGTGEETKIWEENWIPQSGIMRPIVSLVNDKPHLVSELIDSSSAIWREDKVRTVFLPVDANIILRIPLCTRHVQDFWAWGEDKQ